MKKIKVFAAMCAAGFCAMGVHADGTAAYRVETDRPDCLYRCGETATFIVTVLCTSNLTLSGGCVQARLDNFGPDVKTNAVFDISVTNVFRISGTLNEPGFLRLALPKTKDGRKNPSDFSVGFEPEKIRKGSPSPKDFDEFWRNAAADLDANVPLDPQLTLLPERSADKFNFWRISFADVGDTRAYGFLSIPKDASPERKYPVRFQVPAAGGASPSRSTGACAASTPGLALLPRHLYSSRSSNCSEARCRRRPRKMD